MLEILFPPDKIAYQCSLLLNDMKFKHKFGKGNEVLFIFTDLMTLEEFPMSNNTKHVTNEEYKLSETKTGILVTFLLLLQILYDIFLN